MENDELKRLIRQTVYEALQEFFFSPEDRRRYPEAYLPKQFYSMANKLDGATEELGSNVQKLSMLVSKFESWSSPGCKYDVSHISDLKKLLNDLNSKLP